MLHRSHFFPVYSIFLIIFSFLFNTVSQANSDLKFKPGLHMGLSQGHFDWNIASDLSGLKTPDVLSELRYEDLDIINWTFNLDAEKSLNASLNFIFETSFSIGMIDSGNIQDSDFDGNNKTKEYSRSFSSPEGSKTYDFSGALGFENQLTQSLQSALLLGYSYRAQDFVKTEGEQIIATPYRTPQTGSFKGLNSRYEAAWQGPWIGAQLSWTGRLYRLRLRNEYHLSYYDAQANWNLIQSFSHPKSFEHTAQGNGMVHSMEIIRKVSRNLSLLAQYQQEIWHTEDGVDTVFFSSGSTASTRLNETNWQRSMLSFGLQLETW